VVTIPVGGTEPDLVQPASPLDTALDVYTYAHSSSAMRTLLLPERPGA